MARLLGANRGNLPARRRICLSVYEPWAMRGPILARRDTVALAEDSREMRDAREPETECDIRDRAARMQAIAQSFRAPLEPPSQDVATNRLGSVRENPMNVARRQPQG